MLLKTAAIKYQQRVPNVAMIAIHSRTTNTPLSRPYQQNVSTEKLLPPAFVAEKLLKILDNLAGEETLRFLGWQGKKKIGNDRAPSAKFADIQKIRPIMIILRRY